MSQCGQRLPPRLPPGLGEAIEDLRSAPDHGPDGDRPRPDVITDILAQLRMPDADVVHTGFYRSNLDLHVVCVRGETEKKRLLLDFSLRARSRWNGIIYSA